MTTDRPKAIAFTSGFFGWTDFVVDDAGAAAAAAKA